MALEGPLKELHLQDVFQLLELGRKTGTLRVTSELRQLAAVVSFDRGGIVTAAIGNDPPLIGTVLLNARRITEDDLARARTMQTDGDGRRLGDILIALGVITRRELDRQLKVQVEETVCELLSWREGYFRFEEEPTPSDAAVEAPARLPTEALLMEAARRLDEWSRIEDKVPHLGVVPKLPPPEQQANGRLDLVPFEWEILAAVDGERDLRELADTLGRSEFEVARTIYGLTSAGVLVLEDPALTAAVPELDPLVPEARRLLDACDAALARLRHLVDERSGHDLAPMAALAPTVIRLRAAAAILTEELEHDRD